MDKVVEGSEPKKKRKAPHSREFYIAMAKKSHKNRDGYSGAPGKHQYPESRKPPSVKP